MKKSGIFFVFALFAGVAWSQFNFPQGFEFDGAGDTEGWTSDSADISTAEGLLSGAVTAGTAPVEAENDMSGDASLNEPEAPDVDPFVLPGDPGNLIANGGFSQITNEVGGPTMHMAPGGAVQMDRNHLLIYRYWLIYGDLNEIRNSVYELHTLYPHG
jgi:hypothetical protein